MARISFGQRVTLILLDAYTTFGNVFLPSRSVSIQYVCILDFYYDVFLIVKEHRSTTIQNSLHKITPEETKFPLWLRS